MGFLDNLLGRTAHTAKQPIHQVPLHLYNTLSKQKEIFSTQHKTVRMYNCGPTVYGEQHIGNLSMFVFTDILRRTLEFNGYQVKQVINITDVGHLVSDGDDGDDKMTKGLKRDGLELTLENMKKLAEKYARQFIKDLERLNIDTSRISFPRATDHIPGQIALIQTLQEKGYAYKTSDGVYFDTTIFKGYGKLGNIDIEKLKEGARIDVKSEKKHPADFALWKFNPNLGWDAPWGKGFPGWHIECSAMARSELGEQLDIHTGGIEHIPVHHNNEIAQSEAAFGKAPFSKFWMHREHLLMNGKKIAKSDGNVVYLSEFSNEHVPPLALRYWLLTSHYRTPSNFTWEAVKAAHTALKRLKSAYKKLPEDDAGTEPAEALRAFHTAINDDLDTPKALAILWEMLASSIPDTQKRATLKEADRVLGLNLDTHTDEDAAVPEMVLKLAQQRKEARAKKDWAQSDQLREQIAKEGFAVSDAGTEQTLTRL